MNEAVMPRTWDAGASSRWALRTSAIAWFVPAAFGQWVFAWHIAVTYIAKAATGNLGAWNKRLFAGLIDGDLIGNLALIAHLFIAFAVTVGGTLQLVPSIRTHAPAFHRWNGRVYIVLAFVTSLAGIYMIWTRETFGGILMNDIGVSLNGVLIMVCAAQALRHARARRFEIHRRWALRTFMTMSGVWFVRIMYAFLDTLPVQIPGIAEDMTGPTNVAINFASYLLPLAVLEVYLRARRSPSTVARFGAATLVLASAVATTIGVYGRSLRWLAER